MANGKNARIAGCRFSRFGKLTQEGVMHLTAFQKTFLVFLIFLSTSFSVGAVVDNKNEHQLSQFVFTDFVHEKTVVLDAIESDASGLTWDNTNNRLVAVINSPPQIHFLTPAGKHLQKIDLKNFHDTEAISQISGNIYAIVNERRMDIVIVKIDENTSIIDARDFPHITIAQATDENNGIEGLTYNPLTRSFTAVKEKSPKRIFQITLREWPELIDNKAQLDYEVRSAWDLPLSCYFLRDFSGIHFDSETGTYLLLSDASKKVVQLSSTGKFLRRINLENIVQNEVPQPEGIVLSPDRHLYILSEPNLLYVFAPKT